MRAGRRLLAALVGAALAMTLAPAADALNPATAGPAAGSTVVDASVVDASVVGPVAAGPAAGGLLPTALAADFDPGNIISDTVFFDQGAMTVDQIQAFLTTKGAKCAPYEQPCLKDYVTTTVAKAADAYCTGYVGGRAETAAQIIAGVAQSCGVNPRVLLVLLEKEQSLVTRSKPTTYAYERATGFGCPDSAPCNTEYFGLFNQLYLAARQYQRYADPSYSTAYRPGRTVNVLYHPNAAACGSAPVYIENQATAGLYAYTPYQPNSAALANMYGTGDSCSSYGNRNFWRLYTDWFGSTQGGTLVRTADNPTVYIVTEKAKYPVPDAAIMSAYAPLGPVTLVSKAFLDRRPTGQTAGHFARSSDGSIFLVDFGRKYYADTCALLDEWGVGCGSYIQLGDAQVQAMTDAGKLTQGVRTWSGRRYWVEDGARREVADVESLTAAGLSTSSGYLSDNGISWLPVGNPVVRAGTVVTNRATGDYVLVSSAGINPMPVALLSGTAFGWLPRAALDGSSVGRLAPGAPLSAFVRTSTTAYLVRGAELTELADASLVPAGAAVVGTESLAMFSMTGAVHAPLFVNPTGDPLRYEIRAGVRHPVRSDAELTALGGSPAAVLPIRPEPASLIPVGRDAALTRFDDVRVYDPFAADIEWLAAQGITTGYADGTYRPLGSVNRDAMAAFLYRLSGSPAFTPPAVASFADVPTSHPFFREIEWLASRGITTGKRLPSGALVYEPTSPVSREAMAAFLYRLAGSPGFAVPSTSTFPDVSMDNPFRVAIEWMAATKITTGTKLPNGTLGYVPSASVERQAMAAFLHRYTAR